MMEYQKNLPYEVLTEENISFVTEDSHIGYLKSMKEKHKIITLEERYPNASKQLLEILEKMLSFNPYFRPSAKTLLKDSYFDDIRIKNIEITMPHKLNHKIDRDEELQTDYEDE